MRRRLLSVLAATVMMYSGTVHAQTTLWNETFDAVIPPDLPAGWLIGGEGWETSSSSASTGSGGNNLAHLGTAPGAAESPALDLTQVTAADLVFLARRTSSYDAANLIVLASADGGATYPFTVLAAGAALPGTDGQYEEVRAALPAELLGVAQVRFRFEALGGGSAFASARLDDLTLEGDGVILRNGVGFAAESATVLGGAEDFSVPILLQLADAPAGLQGLQMAFRFDTAAVQGLQVAAGPAIASDPMWRLETELHGDELEVLLLGEATTSLPEGAYDPLLWLGVVTNPTVASYETTLEIRRVIASQGDPDGSTLTLATDPATLHLGVEAGQAFFVTSVDTLDLGVVRAGASAQQTVAVSNPGGTVALVVDSVAVSDPLFVVTPQSALVAPDASESFVVTASPLLSDVGVASAEALFYHNAASGTTVLPLQATVVSGRGDLNVDGAVDVLDLVLGIDFVLGRLDSTQIDVAAVDLFPFSAGDGLADVRDLTVLSQAIGRGIWPDGVPIDDSAPAGKASQAVADVTVLLEKGPDVLIVKLEHEEPIRALHVVLDLPESMLAKQGAVRTGVVEAATLSAIPRWEKGSLSLMLYRMDGGLLPPGTVELVRLSHDGGALEATVRQSLVVTADRRRAVARTSVRLSDGAPTPTQPAPGLGAPYPVPLVAGDVPLRLPLYLEADEQGRIEVFDVRGASIRLLHDGLLTAGSSLWTWDGADRDGRRVAPGVYFVRLTTAGRIDHRPVVAVR